jgi:hypothetical protein
MREWKPPMYMKEDTIHWVHRSHATTFEFEAHADYFFTVKTTSSYILVNFLTSSLLVVQILKVVVATSVAGVIFILT